MPDDGRIGKEIDWSLVVPSIIRPTHEPPALEVLDFFDECKHFRFNVSSEGMKTAIPDIEARLLHMDLLSEILPLNMCFNWAKETRWTAKVVGNSEKMRLYDGLMEAHKLEQEELDKEYFDMVDRFKIGPGIPVSWLNKEEASSTSTRHVQKPAVRNPPMVFSFLTPQDIHFMVEIAIAKALTNPGESAQAELLPLLPRRDGTVSKRRMEGCVTSMARKLCCTSPFSDSD